MRTNELARKMIGPVGLLVWASAVLAGMVGTVRYETRPGPTAAGAAAGAPAQWPATVHLSRDAHRPTLVMSLHPHCPCSRASVHELEMLMSRADARVSAHVLFVQPNGAPNDWLNTDLWNDARAIPRMSVEVDSNGSDSAALGATTSGQVVMYDANGNLQFAGGITDGRGHEGDNAGVDAILALLRDQKASTNSTPVYGCPLCGASDIMVTCGPRRNQ